VLFNIKAHKKSMCPFTPKVCPLDRVGIMNNQRNQIVVQHNALIEAHYKLEPTEKKLVLLIASMIKPEDKDFQDYWLTVQEVMEIFGVSGKSYYEHLRDHTKGILKKPLAIMTEIGELFCNWFSTICYYRKEGRIRFRFDPDLKPYLLGLQSQYTPFELKYALQLKSFYSIRLYELLKQYVRPGKRFFTLEDLKLKLGIDEDKYKRYTHLKARVLNPATKEIIAGSDIRVSYKEKKHIRRVIGIEFAVKKAWIIPESVINAIPKEHRTDRHLLAALDRNADRGETVLKKIIQYVIHQKPIHSFIGYQCHCLDNGYGAEFDPKQPLLFEEKPLIPVFPGLRLKIGDKIMTVEHGNVLRFEKGVMPEGDIRRHINEGTFEPIGTDNPLPLHFS
jgi:hypothetical protein